MASSHPPFQLKQTVKIRPFIYHALVIAIDYILSLFISFRAKLIHRNGIILQNKDHRFLEDQTVKGGLYIKPLDFKIYNLKICAHKIFSRPHPTKKSQVWLVATPQFRTTSVAN